MQINSFLEQCVALGHILTVVVLELGNDLFLHSILWVSVGFYIDHLILNVLWGLITCYCTTAITPSFFLVTN